MSEWLTTGQMIDQLKVGEEAETHPDDIYVRVKRFEDGIYRMYVVGGESTGIVEGDEGALRLNDMYIKLRWRILPRYVSIEEAIKAYRNGKTVVLHLGDKKFRYSKSFVDEDNFGLHTFIHGKWTIED
jgi:hypothetical protein